MLTRTAPAAMALLLGAVSAFAQPAFAQPPVAQEEPIASARSVETTDAQIRQYLDAAAAPAGVEDAAPAPVDNRPHGEFEVGIGTGGYRHAHAATVVPFGDIGTAAIAVSDTRFNDRFGPRKQQTLSVAVNLGDGARPAGPACVREQAKRGLQPMWVTRMRADQATAAGAACVPR